MGSASNGCMIKSASPLAVSVTLKRIRWLRIYLFTKLFPQGKAQAWVNARQLINVLSPAEFEKQVSTAGAGHASTTLPTAGTGGSAQSAAQGFAEVEDRSRLPKRQVRQAYAGLSTGCSASPQQVMEAKRSAVLFAKRAITWADVCEMSL